MVQFHNIREEFQKSSTNKKTFSKSVLNVKVTILKKIIIQQLLISLLRNLNTF